MHRSQGSAQRKLFILRRALDETDTYGIGEVAFSGQKHLVATGAPADPKQKGLTLYILRYAEEIRDAKAVLGSATEPSGTSQELKLAKQLLESSTSKFGLDTHKDDFQAAVVKLVNAKRKGKPLPQPEPARTHEGDQHHGRSATESRRALQ